MGATLNLLQSPCFLHIPKYLFQVLVLLKTKIIPQQWASGSTYSYESTTFAHAESAEKWNEKSFNLHNAVSLTSTKQMIFQLLESPVCVSPKLATLLCHQARFSLGQP